MGETIPKLLDRMPYFDGGFRSRMISGALLLMMIWPSVKDLRIIAYYIEMFDSIYNSVSLPIAVFLLIGTIIYIVGLILELSGTVIMNSIYENKSMKIEEKYLRIHNQLSENGQSFIQNCPELVQSGIDQHLCTNFDIAWRFLENNADDDDRRWLKHRYSNRRMVLSLINAIILGVLWIIMHGFLIFFKVIVESATETVMSLESERWTILMWTLLFIIVLMALALIWIFRLYRKFIEQMVKIYSSLTRHLLISTIEYLSLEKIQHRDKIENISN